VNGFEFLAEAYRATEPDYDGRISVPVLWDKETEVIVSNESADAWGEAGLYPEEHDSLNPKRISARGPLDLDFTS
jgi:putative glutathione S-transferase